MCRILQYPQVPPERVRFLTTTPLGLPIPLSAPVLQKRFPGARSALACPQALADVHIKPYDVITFGRFGLQVFLTRPLYEHGMPQLPQLVAWEARAIADGGLTEESTSVRTVGGGPAGFDLS